ncbi:ribosomal protein L32 [Cryptococcus tetragattii IND107]|uniref:Large ribosomal subunit protein bL32m n=1 Tax=Cryptococcus tetragattii IND107 TaxID=1296105 RepID=A0ABR3BW54_9TREE|nr:ribosomal protein L32 [Cryptococcus tetragattii IND107]
MAALQLTNRSLNAPFFSLRSFLPALRSSWPTPCEASSSSSTLSSSLVASAPSTSSPSLSSLFPSFSLESLLELIPPFVWASVPKKKVSHSRKNMRAANKGLKNKTNLSLCPACGSIKLTHHVCPTCYSQISRRWKEEARNQLPSALHSHP